LLTAQAAAILECATIYDLDEEKGTLVGVREKVKERQRAEKDYPRPTVTKRSLRRRIHLEGLKSKERFTSRALAAIFGGLAVIVPMLIMSLHPTRLTQLLTASIFVVSVALILAWVMDEAERKDIIAATAAYGAVLVVFVGASATTT
jgi:VIT1/CCC1 family predicted Fe2+/Mn2+ transporter